MARQHQISLWFPNGKDEIGIIVGQVRDEIWELPFGQVEKNELPTFYEYAQSPHYLLLG